MFPDIPAGYSDHTLPDLTPHAVEAAVALGARVIEKHFTFDTSRPGYDHELSADEPALKTLVENCRIIETALGRPDLVHTENEERVRLYGRRGAVSRRAIRKGERFSSDNVIVKRPATGIQPRELDRLYGSAASRDIPEDHVIDWEMVERS
jgi:N-acetylneuraminate synthase